MSFGTTTWIADTIENSETKRLTLEELDQVFSVPVRDFSRYQVTEVLPYFIKRWIFFRREVRLRPFYPWELEREESLLESKPITSLT